MIYRIKHVYIYINLIKSNRFIISDYISIHFLTFSDIFHECPVSPFFGPPPVLPSLMRGFWKGLFGVFGRVLRGYLEGILEVI